MLGSDSLQFLECGENFGVVGHLLIDGLKDAPGEIVIAGSIEGQAEDAPEWQIVGIPIDQDLQSFGRLLPFAGIDVDLGGSEIESVSPAVQSVGIQPLGTRFIQSAEGGEDLCSQSVTVCVIGPDSNGLIDEFKGFDGFGGFDALHGFSLLFVAARCLHCLVIAVHVLLSIVFYLICIACYRF